MVRYRERLQGSRSVLKAGSSGGPGAAVRMGTRAEGGRGI